MRYGLTIKELIEQQLPQGTSVSQSMGGDTGATGLYGLAGELANVQDEETSNAFNRTVAKQGQKLAHKGADVSDEGAEGEETSVTAYGSGNAAQVYFDLYPRKITLERAGDRLSRHDRCRRAARGHRHGRRLRR